MLRLFSNFSLESRLLPWQHRYKTLKTSLKAIGQEKDGRKRKVSFLLTLPASRYPSLAISSPSFVSSVSPIRCSKKSIRLSLPTRSIVFSFSEHGPFCFSLLLSLSTPVRHFASHVEKKAATMRAKWCAENKGGRMTQKGWMHTWSALLRPPSIRHSWSHVLVSRSAPARPDPTSRRRTSILQSKPCNSGIRLLWATLRI